MLGDILVGIIDHVGTLLTSPMTELTLGEVFLGAFFIFLALLVAFYVIIALLCLCGLFLDACLTGFGQIMTTITMGRRKHGRRKREGESKTA